MGTDRSSIKYGTNYNLRIVLLSHLPSTSSLEVLILFSSLTTTDPGSIHKTLSRLLAARIRVSIIALAAELKICRLITEKTHGKFGVALNEAHYRELLFEMVQAPATTMQGTIGLKSAMEGVAKRTGGSGSSNGKAPPADLMMMGFPTRLPLAGAGAVGLCACHGLVRRGGYLCPRCGAKACEVPTDCEVCGLMVVSSPHLARR
jgi:transcription initiation factor TFIIH subunit 2